MIRVVEAIIEIIGFLRILASPLLIGGITGFFIYFSDPTPVRLGIGIGVGAIGLGIGLWWAIATWKKYGTCWTTSTAITSRELEKAKNRMQVNFKLVRTDSSNPDFVSLVKHLDAYLAEKDGDEHPFYAQYNKIDKLKYVVVAYEGKVPVSCGAIKEFVPGTAEVKRMYTAPQGRRKGYAAEVLKELEKWAKELGYKSCILETGKRQEEAVEFYKKNGYKFIPNFGQYAGVENSLCFEKVL